MGFAWSSCIAQDTLLGICSRSGLDESMILACDTPLPKSLSVAFAVATDDLMFFSESGVGITTIVAERVEHTMRTYGVIKNPEKDINDTINTTCVGVDLIDGHSWAPPGIRTWQLLDALLDLCTHRRASPGSVASYLGVTQWYNLLRRLRLCVFDNTYAFSNGDKAKDWVQQLLSDGVFAELMMDGVFFLFGTVNMRLPFMDFIAATDASTCYGIGGTIAKADAEDIRNIARMACKSGGHVRLDESPLLSDALSSRLGPRYDLGLQLSDFSVVFSVNIVSPGYINLEEAKALIHLVRWVLRSKRRFCHRLVVLVDSKVVIGGVTKGRSSSVQLNALIRKLAALCFAGNLLLHCVFIPTSHNPADWPSRGPYDTWHPALRRGSGRRPKAHSCPACGVEPKDHPLDQPRRLRGQGLPCRGFGPRFFYDHQKQEWLSDLDSCMRRWRQADNTSDDFAAFLDDLMDNN
jgi:hypothetical protein